MQKPLYIERACNLEQDERSRDIGLDHWSRVVDAPIYVGLRGEMDNNLAPLHGLRDGFRVTDVAFHEPISGTPRNRVQIGKISRVGQLVEVDDAMAFAERENIPDEVRANKPGPTCNKDFH